MKKDYIPTDDEKKDETSFVEEYWTRIWEHRKTGGSAPSSVEKDEKYSILTSCLQKLPSGARILDGGCGLGEWVVHLKEKGFDAVGLDISEKTIVQLKKQHPRVSFVHGDIRNTGFQESSFDAYFSWGAFEHFEAGLGACFTEAQRILKPDGILIVSVPFHNGRLLRKDARELAQTDEHFDSTAGYRSEMRFYQWRLTKGELQREFELHDFETLQITPINRIVGMRRMLKHDLGLEPNTFLHRALSRLLPRLVSKECVSHMIVGVGRKRRAKN